MILYNLQKINGYLPKDDGGKAAMKDADIIIIPAGIPRKCRALPSLYSRGGRGL